MNLEKFYVCLSELRRAIDAVIDLLEEEKPVSSKFRAKLEQALNDGTLVSAKAHNENVI